MMKMKKKNQQQSAPKSANWQKPKNQQQKTQGKAERKEKREKRKNHLNLSL